MHRSLCAWVVFLVSWPLASPDQARAYRTFTDLPELEDAAGEPIAWNAFPIELELSRGEGAPADDQTTLRALERAMQLWHEAMCTKDIFGEAGLTDLAATDDGHNTVQWVTIDWGAIGDANALATTRPVYEKRAGRYELIEADIFLNADTVAWSDDMIDQLDGVLAHELGHALGLSHPCEPDGRAGAPSCEDEDELALMHPLYDPARAALTSDDEAGACFLYPQGPVEMAPAGGDHAGGGCAVTRGRARSWTAATLLMIALAASITRAARSGRTPASARSRP